MSQNHYQILGIAPTATAREIKLAYKKLAVKYHPDKNGGSSLHEELFKAVAAAYHVLGDPGRRAQYDFQLQVAARRAEEVRRQQQFRNQGQRVYGVPMPPPTPAVRTRRPAGSHERHYRTIPRQRVKFTRRDLRLILLLIGGILLFVLAVRITMYRVTAASNYRRGLAAYARQEWSAAHSFFSEALHFRPDYADALRRRGELEEIIYHHPALAAADYRAALAETTSPARRAQLLVRLSLCYRALQRPDLVQTTIRQALEQDSTLARARLLRGEARLFAHQYAAARRDFDAGLRTAAAEPAYVEAQLLLYRGLAHFKAHDLRAARADYWQVLATYPRQGQVYFLLGRIAQQEGNATEACEFFRRAVVQGYQFAEAARADTCPQPSK
ncbi:DnaJ domain-containing protein [Hymenobacter sp. HSC-4F20]|uniref:J domain-containing protein n=1 Tax=Hymenobacter sp. HSC-4F20 TaxID=2864135 RepID=UPI001C737B9E|nr:J domain-containing protein [Hymenobacter sp. HSC-4F20]MBX0291931.1 DnaJ domain-containing protein [Hymenobacter sp. HSC-4F20]